MTIVNYKLLAPIVLSMLFLSCTRNPYYYFPQKVFGLAIPRTIENLYDIDTVNCGFGECPEKVLVLRVDSNEFQKRFGGLKFQDIKQEDIHKTPDGRPMLEVVTMKQDSIGNEVISGAGKFHEQNLHYPFRFEQAKIYRHRNSHNRVILYSPGQRVLILYAFGHFGRHS